MSDDVDKYTDRSVDFCGTTLLNRKSNLSGSNDVKIHDRDRGLHFET